jgi:hypothetical protein
MPRHKRREPKKVTPGKVASQAHETKSDKVGILPYRPSRKKAYKPVSSSKAFAVLARMRRTGESLEVASRSKHTYPAYVLEHLKKAARREHQPNPLRTISGEWVASSSDKLLRHRELLTEDGYISIIVKGSKTSSELSRYNAIVEQLVNPEKYAKRLGLSKDDVFGQALDDLKDFKGKRIGGKPYLTDPEQVFRLADFDVIKTEELGSDQVSRGGRR